MDDNIGTLAGGVAHTINNQLTAIMGNAQFALQTLQPNSPAYPMLEEISSASLRVADLCNKLLRYAGKSPFQMETVSLESILHAIRPVLECSVPPTVSLFFCTPDTIPNITADRHITTKATLIQSGYSAAPVLAHDGLISADPGNHAKQRYGRQAIKNSCEYQRFDRIYT